MADTLFEVQAGLRKLADALADDLRMLAALHSEELTAGRIAELRAVDFPRALGLRLAGDEAREAAELMHQAVTGLPPDPDSATLDGLAADFADIYLTYKLHASPCESVWLDEDGLRLQGPMFEIRRRYQEQGLAAADWRQRSDDHLVLQMQFIAHLVSGDDAQAAWQQAADFMDHHLLLWIDEFARRVATRCATPFYAGLAALTAAYLDELRDLAAEILAWPRPSRGEIEAERQRRRGELAGGTGSASHEAPLVSVPATGPSW